MAIERLAEDDVAVIAGQCFLDFHHFIFLISREAPDAVGFIILPMNNAAVMR